MEQALLKKGWELTEIGKAKDWWDDEHWVVQYTYDPSISFYLCFIVDPQFEDFRKKGQGIYQLLGSTKFPESWNDTSSKISSISMTKRKFNCKLSEFMIELEQFKNTRKNDRP